MTGANRSDQLCAAFAIEPKEKRYVKNIFGFALEAFVANRDALLHVIEHDTATVMAVQRFKRQIGENNDRSISCKYTSKHQTLQTHRRRHIKLCCCRTARMHIVYQNFGHLDRCRS